MESLAAGWPISAEWRSAIAQRRHRWSTAYGTVRERVACQRAAAWGALVYVAVSPCGSLAKVGVSKTRRRRLTPGSRP